MAGYIGSTPVPQGIQEQQSFTATAGQTTFNTLGYTDGNTIRVTLNGVLLEGGGVDYTATNGSDIVLTAAAIANDILTFETFNEFQLVSQTMTTPTISGGTLKSNVTLKNDTEQDTDGGRASKIIYQGEQSGGEISTLAEIQASHDGTADDEKADLIFRVNDGSDGTSPTEAMRIDSSRNVLIGTADPNPTSSSVNTAGQEFSTTGGVRSTVDGNPSATFNRKTDDGDIAIFRKDGSTVGSIGTYSGDMIVGTGDTRVRFIDSLDCIVPVSDAVGTSRDAGVDLGYSSIRYKDIYTSGGIYLGAASAGSPVASNYLDDYEEGTWTPTSPTVTLTGSPSGHYTKIGRMVVYTCTFQFPSSSSGVQAMIDGLPFSDNGTGAGSFLRYTNHGSYYTVTISGNRLYFYDLGGSATSIASVDPRRFDLIGVLMTA